MRHAHWLVAMTGTILYGVALIVPTFDGINGFQVLVFGLMFGYASWILIIWLANPAICVAIIAATAGRWHLAAWTAGSATLLSLAGLCLFAREVTRHPVVWYWCGSAVFLFVASLCVMSCDRDWRSVR